MNSWLDQHSDSLRIPRVVELRGLRDVGKDFGYKLQGMARRIKLEDLSVARTKLSELLAALKKAEDDVTKRASRIWDSVLQSEGDLQDLLDEVETLVPAFEGCDEDVEDLQIMRRVLQAFQRYYRQLANEHLSSTELDALAERLKEEALSLFGNEELPWDIEVSFEGFLSEINSKRTQNSASWIDELRDETTELANMPASEANRLHAKCQAPPPFLTEQDRKVLDGIISGLEECLNDLALDWLIERFTALPKASKQKLLELVGAVPRPDGEL